VCFVRDNKRETSFKVRALDDTKAAYSRLKNDIDQLHIDKRSYLKRLEVIEANIQRLKCRIQNLQSSAEVSH
jgi:predicted nuclease with TOPRIM domain